MTRITIAPNASGTGVMTLAAPNTNTDRTLTLPDVTTTLVGTDATQTLSNKTLTGPLAINTNSASEAATITQTGAGIALKTVGGNIVMAGAATQELSFTIGEGRTGNGYSYIDLVGDATYTDFGMRIMREVTGPNANSTIQHRGTGNLILNTQEAAAITFTTAATERMRIDATGYVTTPYQPAFTAKGLASQTTYTLNQVIVFNTAPLNIGSGYSTSTGRFTAPVAGTYAFTFQVYLNPGNGNAPIAFYKNGTMEIFFLQGVTMSGIGLSTIISLAASDYVEVRVRNTAGASATVFNSADHTQFTGYLIG